MFNGYITAAITPFENNKIDIAAFEKYVNYIVNSGVSGIVICGSTGESLSLSLQEKIELIKVACRVNSKKIKLIAGVIDSVTDSCKSFIKKTEQYVDGFLCICPFYIKPSQLQIYEHFKQLNCSTSKGIILYNNPSRVGTCIGFDTLKKLCNLKNIVAIKECDTDLSKFSLLRSEIKETFDFLTGNDDNASAALSMGASGVISVSSNIVPDQCIKIFNAFKQSNFERLGILRNILAPFHKMMFAEPSPAPVKYALSRLGLISNELRAPLSVVNLELQQKIDNIMNKLEII